mmetsp:Transcript_83193/g.239129  ORF Transcript_83193/g.239129 Transcript_83193/m.239129 type:complete len:208 (-) Transcript_83193:588-1211(-)
MATLPGSVRQVLDSTIEALVFFKMSASRWQQLSLNKSSPYRECRTPSMSKKITTSGACICAGDGDLGEEASASSTCAEGAHAAKPSIFALRTETSLRRGATWAAAAADAKSSTLALKAAMLPTFAFKVLNSSRDGPPSWSAPPTPAAAKPATLKPKAERSCCSWPMVTSTAAIAECCSWRELSSDLRISSTAPSPPAPAPVSAGRSA